MDDDRKTYLDAMRRDIAAREQGFLSTKGLLINKAIVTGRHWVTNRADQ